MYNLFDNNAVRPEGWLKDQLLIQARGLAGNLDKVWPDVQDSAWIGGAQDGWERVPYWLDGFIPLAFLLDEADMKDRAAAYINAIVGQQQPDGWICPCADDERAGYDIWALFLIGKVLALYCQFTGDRRVEAALYRAMKNGKMMLEEGAVALKDWGKYRWFEALVPLLFLKRRYHESWIGDFVAMLRAQGTDYLTLTGQWKRPLNKWSLDTHIVNIAMALKYEALSTALLGGEYQDRAEELWNILETYNGTAVGTFTGDECLSGTDNIQGTELCGVVEMMYSCETLFALTGDTIWAERLEKIAFNALPAALTDDMWAHQYDQMVNQIACETFPNKPIFRTNWTESHLFGLEPNCGCCTANHGQGWPKLAMNAFLQSDQGICCPVMLPASLTTVINGVAVRVRMTTEYPFRSACAYTVECDAPVRFALRLRIPRWAKNLKIDGAPAQRTEELIFDKMWSERETITVTFSDTPHLIPRPRKLWALAFGPLVFALPIQAAYKKLEYERNGHTRRFPYCDYELSPQSPWNFGFAGRRFTVETSDVSDVPFSSARPPLRVKAALAPVEWPFADGYETVSAPALLSGRAIGDAREMTLIPYACAKLRMTEMPVVRKPKHQKEGTPE